MSLEEYEIQPHCMNLQTRLLSGQIGHPITNLDLEKAKHHIEKSFSVVGLTEMFNESVYIMKRSFNWHNIQYKKQNVTKKKPETKNLSPQTIQSIKENNYYDILLYRFAKDRLILQINHLPPKAKKELIAFKQGSNYSIRNKRNGS
jgi:hypothetical protein